MEGGTKEKMRKEKGITLVSLVITIVVLLIIASTTIHNGMVSLDNTKLNGFYMYLETVQKKVDEVASTNETFIDSSGNTIIVKQAGIAYSDLEDDKKTLLQQIIQLEEPTLNPQNFRYFTTQNLKNILDLEDARYNVFIDFDNRIIIAEEGIKIGDTTYYMLKNNIYHSEYSTSKLPTLIIENPFSYSIIEYGTEQYKITVMPNYTYSDYTPKDAILKYKNVESKYWEMAEDLQFVINELGVYEISYEDSADNNITKLVEVKHNENESPTIQEYVVEN